MHKNYFLKIFKNIKNILDSHTHFYSIKYHKIVFKKYFSKLFLKIIIDYTF